MLSFVSHNSPHHFYTVSEVIDGYEETAILEVNEITGGLLELLQMKTFNTKFTGAYSLEKQQDSQ